MSTDVRHLHCTAPLLCLRHFSQKMDKIDYAFTFTPNKGQTAEAGGPKLLSKLSPGERSERNTHENCSAQLRVHDFLFLFRCCLGILHAICLGLRDQLKEKPKCLGCTRNCQNVSAERPANWARPIRQRPFRLISSFNSGSSPTFALIMDRCSPTHHLNPTHFFQACSRPPYPPNWTLLSQRAAGRCIALQLRMILAAAATKLIIHKRSCSTILRCSRAAVSSSLTSETPRGKGCRDPIERGERASRG